MSKIPKRTYKQGYEEGYRLGMINGTCNERDRHEQEQASLRTTTELLQIITQLLLIIKNQKP